MNRKDDPANPFEPGDPLKDENFSKYWYGIFTSLIVIVVVLIFLFRHFLPDFFHHAR